MPSRTQPNAPERRPRSTRRDQRITKMLVKITSDLSRAHVDSVDGEIERALQVLGRHVNVEIVSLLARDRGSVLATQHQWRTVGWMDPPLEIDVRHATWWMARHRAGEDIVIHDIDDLGVEALHERLQLVQRGTRSLLAIALDTSRGGESYLVLERHRDPRKWRASDIEFASAVAEAIAAASDRRDQQRALVEAAAHAEATGRERADFLAVLAHEFRSSLQAIVGYAQLIEAEAPLRSPTVERVRHILTSADHLASLAEDALDLARIDAGQLSLSTSDIDVRDVAAAAIATVAPRAKERGVTIVERMPGAPVNAHADSRRLRQIVINLLGNAVKFSDAGSQVTLRLEQRESGYSIEVEDTGAGIPARDRRRIFEAFARGRRGSEDGVGLGLALVQRLCALHGGDVNLADRDAGSGALFRVTLPSTPPPPPPGRFPFLDAV